MWANRNSHSAVGMLNGKATLEGGFGVSHKTEHTLTTQPNSRTLCIYPKEWKPHIHFLLPGGRRACLQVRCRPSPSALAASLPILIDDAHSPTLTASLLHLLLPLKPENSVTCKHSLISPFPSFSSILRFLGRQESLPSGDPLSYLLFTL